MSLKYLVCIHIETTCGENILTTDNPEIIEFAAVMINLDTGLIETQFKYMRMEPSNVLRMNDVELMFFSLFNSHFGTSNSSAHLLDVTKNVMETFDKWMEERDLVFFDHNNRQQNAAVCTWTDRDIGLFWRRECQRRSIAFNEYFRRRIDAQATYKSFTRDYSDVTFTRALRRIGVPCRRGRPSSMKNARNLSRMMVTIVQSGYELGITNFD